MIVAGKQREGKEKKVGLLLLQVFLTEQLI